MYTHQGRWRHDLPAWTHWCDGFLPGIMWILCARGDGSWREPAERYTRRLEPRQFDREVHDLGFLFISTYGRWYALTGDPALNAVLIQAGRTMALRFREKGAYLRSFVAEDSLFIDIMMNVGIVFYAARETGDASAARHRHAALPDHPARAGARRRLDRARRTVRSGNRRVPAADHPAGIPRRFLLVARAGVGALRLRYGVRVHPRRALLRTAEACADFYIATRPADGVPPWDFDAPAESRGLVDTSAAAIAASGLLQLADIAGDNAYRNSARAHPHHPLRALPGGRRSRLGGHSEGRRVPSP